MNQVADLYGRADVLVLEATALRIIPPVHPEKYPTRHYTIEIRCPYCGRVHTHGWRDPGGELKPQRLAHCMAGAKLYPGFRFYEYHIRAEHIEEAAR